MLKKIVVFRNFNRGVQSPQSGTTSVNTIIPVKRSIHAKHVKAIQRYQPQGNQELRTIYKNSIQYLKLRAVRVVAVIFRSCRFQPLWAERVGQTFFMLTFRKADALCFQ